MVYLVLLYVRSDDSALLRTASIRTSTSRRTAWDGTFNTAAAEFSSYRWYRALLMSSRGTTHSLPAARPKACQSFACSTQNHAATTNYTTHNMLL